MIRVELTEYEAFSVLAALSTERQRVEVFPPGPHLASLVAVSDRIVAAIEAQPS